MRVDRSEACRRSALNRRNEIDGDHLYELSGCLTRLAEALSRRGARLKIYRRGDSVRIDGATKAERAMKELEKYLQRDDLDIPSEKVDARPLFTQV